MRTAPDRTIAAATADPPRALGYLAAASADFRFPFFFKGLGLTG